MQVYVYRAALYCDSCGQGVRAEFQRPAHVDPDNESSYDSDDWPKGPYPDGGGEADSPQHCDACGVFLRNPLTADGMAYVREAAAALRPGPCVAKWLEFYGA